MKSLSVRRHGLQTWVEAVRYVQGYGPMDAGEKVSAFSLLSVKDGREEQGSVVDCL